MESSLDPFKTSTLITIIQEGLKDSKSSYKVNTFLSKAELVEMQKHFTVKQDEYDDRLYEFKLK